MKKNLFILFAVILFAACSQKEPSVLTVNGTIEGGNAENLCLYEVQNQRYQSVKLIATIAVANGRFTYSNDSLQTDLYFLSSEDITKSPETMERGTFLFLRKGNNEMSVSINAKNEMRVETKDYPLQSSLIEFTDEMRKVTHSPVLDSLNQLFYAARDKDDMEALKRIKEQSMPYYDEIDKKERNLIDTQIEENKTSLFGLYLFYTYRFQNSSFSTAEEIADIRKRLANLDEEAKKSSFFDKITEKLTILENCAVGQEAPEITGLDSLGNSVKLSDFRGKYVLVDFWSSGCSWCRLETPNFQKTYTAFKDKNLVVLGVSSDFSKEDWLKAIHEDKSYWTQILVQKDEIQKIFNSYAIVGIPEILLVDPQGVILAKGLRGEDIYNTVDKYVK